MRRRGAILIVALLALSLVATGCATKKYVKQQIDPISGKVAELEQVNKKQDADIKDVDTRAQQGIQAASNRAEAADVKADAAGRRAETAQTTANRAQSEVTRVEGQTNAKFAGLDQYQEVDKAEVLFKVNRWQLDDAAKATLDGLAAKLKNAKGCVITVEGFADTTGDENYNMGLSQKRADSVLRYFVTQHQVPLFRLTILGLGETGSKEENRTREGRAKNRRVDVRLLKSAVESGS